MYKQQCLLTELCFRFERCVGALNTLDNPPGVECINTPPSTYTRHIFRHAHSHVALTLLATMESTQIVPSQPMYPTKYGPTDNYRISTRDRQRSLTAPRRAPDEWGADFSWRISVDAAESYGFLFKEKPKPTQRKRPLVFAPRPPHSRGERAPSPPSIQKTKRTPRPRMTPLPGRDTDSD